MSVFKRKRKVKDKNGRTVVKLSQCWYVEYKDADGITRRVKGYQDKTATRQLESQLIRESEQAQVGMVDRFKEHRKAPLRTHLDDFKQYLTDKGGTDDHASVTYNRVKSVFDSSGFVFINDVQPSKIQRYISMRKKDGLGLTSCNHYLRAVKTFFNWMKDDQRTDRNPITHLKPQNTEKDIRRKRRAITLEDIEKLLNVTLNGKKHHSMTGFERYMLYTLAMNTGYRAKEIWLLRGKSFDFNPENPTVTVMAGYTKNKKEAVIPLTKDVADKFEQWFKERGLQTKDSVFPDFNKSKGAKMLKSDLEEAGVPYKDEDGKYADFHSLRHTFITNVVKSGATIKEAQALARHSTANLTMNVYTHLTKDEERQAINRLPKLHTDKDCGNAKDECLDDVSKGSDSESDENLTGKWTGKRTGTPSSDSDQKDTNGTIGSKDARDLEIGEKSENTSNSCNNGDIDTKKDSLSSTVSDKNIMGRRGFEPRTHGFSVHCSTN